VRWASAPNEEADTVQDLEAWFEDYLLASSLNTGSAVYVTWDGIQYYDGKGGQRVGKWLQVGWSISRRDRRRLDSYQALVDEIRGSEDATAAAELLRNALTLVSESQEAAASDSYRAVEGLVATVAAGDWRRLGDNLTRVGYAISGDDLIQLWASFQFYRHDRSMTKKAQTRLNEIGRDKLDYGRCCWLAADIVECFASARARGLI
jgi:phage gp37-like protein